MAYPEIMPSVFQPLEVRPRYLGILRQVIDSLSHGVIGEHGEDLSDRTPLHPLSRPTTCFDNYRRVFREFIKIGIPFEPVSSLL